MALAQVLAIVAPLEEVVAVAAFLEEALPVALVAQVSAMTPEMFAAHPT